MNDDFTERLIHGVESWRDLEVTQQRDLMRQFQSLANSSPDAIGSLIRALSKVDLVRLNSAQQLVSSFFASLNNRIKSSDKQQETAAAASVSPRDISLLYRHLGQACAARYSLLAVLARIGSADSLAEFAELILHDSPQTDKDVLTAFEPLFVKKDFDPADLFPQLFGGLGQPKVASIVLDLANYVFRNGLTQMHPIADRLDQMRQLLGNLTSRLELLAENPTRHAADAESIAEQVADATSLIISLCDSLALANDYDSVEVLLKAASVPHRRIRVEAFAALAKMGNEKGKRQLIALTSEPSIRLRALEYAKELDFLDEIDPQYLTDASLAESRLAMWLGQPTQMGIPPTRLELIDQRTQYWPGYDDPVDCFLFRFFYSLGGGEYSNIGSSGPATHAFLADLADLPVNQIYAAFAGWQAEHEEIEQFDPLDLNPHYETDLSRLQRRLNDRGYEMIEPKIFGRFFGQNVLVAIAAKEQHSGIAIVGNECEMWFPQRHSRNPLSPEEAYCIYKGQQLLQAFNPETLDES